jgi:hypothetical protein
MTASCSNTWLDRLLRCLCYFISSIKQNTLVDVWLAVLLTPSTYCSLGELYAHNLLLAQVLTLTPNAQSY